MAQGLVDGESADLAATVDLGVLTRQVARACHDELLNALKCGAEVSKDPQEARNALQDALQIAKSRLLRLSILVHGSCEDGALASGLTEAQRCRGLERHVHQVCQFRDHMARMHRELHLALATRQHDVEAAASLLSGSGLDRVGLPAMAGDLVESLMKPYAVWRLSPERYAAAGERLVTGTLDYLAESSISKDPERLRVEVRPDGVQFVAPGAFTVDAVYDLKRWAVVKATTITGGGHGLAVAKDGEQALRKHLQSIAAAEPAPSEGGDVPAAICSAAHAFCSHLWLRVLHSEAMQLARERQWELGSVWWDRRGFLLLRVCPQWDPTCGGLCQAQDVLDATGNAVATGADEEQREEEEDAGNRRGCAVELHAHPDGGICFKSSPDLGLRPVAPLALEAGGAALLERLIVEARGVLAARHLDRVQTALIDGGIVPAQDLELIAGGPVLRASVRECPLHVLMDAAGRLSVCADGWSEVHSGPRSTAALAPGTEGLAARLEDARWEALCAAVSREAAAGGWSPLAGAGPGQETADSTARVRKYQYRLDDHAFALSFVLLDTEVASPVLTLAEWPSAEIEAALSRPRVTVQDLEPFAFSGCAGGSCINALREGLRRALTIARRAVEALQFGSRVFESIVRNTPAALALNIAACGAVGAIPLGANATAAAPSKLSASYSGGRFQCVLDWPAEGGAPKKQRRAMPFLPPVRIMVEESSRRWTMCGSLRSEFPMFLPSQATPPSGATSSMNATGQDPEPLASGGRIHSRRLKRRGGARSVCRELVLEFGEGDNWKHWPRDLRTLALLADLSAQAVEGEATSLPARLELCKPGRLRWCLPGPLRGGGEEIFELVAAGEEGGGQEDRQAVLCTFQWIAPRPRFLLAPQLSRQACRTRDLAAALRTLAATAELVRLAEGLAEEEEGWSTFGFSADSLSIEYRAMLGVALHVAAPGQVVCQCLSRQKRREGRPPMGVVPSFDAFMRLLAAAGANRQESHSLLLAEAPGTASGCLPFAPGHLGTRLAPLWAYLQRYCVLLQIYMLMRTEHGGLLSGSSFEMCVTDPRDAADPTITWVYLQWTRPALDRVCKVELFTAWADADDTCEPPAFKRQRQDLSFSPRQSSGQAGGAPGTEVLLRFTLTAAEGLDVRPSPGCRERAERVCRGFEAYFDRLLASNQSPRVMRLLMPLVLLGAPQLWMLEEAALLLSQNLQAGAAWVLLTERLMLVPPSGSAAAAPAWRLRFELEQSAHSGHAGATCSVTCVWREGELAAGEQEGWDEVLVDGTPIAVWTQRGSALEAVVMRRAPYLLAEILGPLFESLGNSRRRRGSRGLLP